jgi:hypothetical protein
LARPRPQPFQACLLPLGGEEVGKKLRRLRLTVEGLVAEQLPGCAGEDRDALDRGQLLVPHGLDHGLMDGLDAGPNPVELMLEVSEETFENRSTTLIEGVRV